MNKKTLKLLAASVFSLLLIMPAYGRGGFGGGGFGGGGFRGGGGFDRGAGGFNRGDVGNRDFGGAGFDRLSGRDEPQSYAGGNTYNHETNVNSSQTANVAGYHGYDNHPYGAYGDHPYANHPYAAYGYNHHPYYGAYGCYGGIYGYPGGWYDDSFLAASMGTCMGLTGLYGFLGMEAANNNNNKQQMAATNVTYEGSNIYVGGQPAQKYYQQGQQLAAQAPMTRVPTADANITTATVASALTASPPAAYVPAGPVAAPFAPLPTVATPLAEGKPAATKWQPLGVYALAPPGQNESTMLFQLAINKDGIVRGNYLNKITNEKTQVHGALDKTDQRVSWTIGDNPQTVFGSSLKELTKDRSKVVVQFGPDSAEQMSLIRQKTEKENASPTTNPES